MWQLRFQTRVSVCYVSSEYGMCARTTYPPIICNTWKVFTKTYVSYSCVCVSVSKRINANWRSLHTGETKKKIHKNVGADFDGDVFSLISRNFTSFIFKLRLFYFPFSIDVRTLKFLDWIENKPSLYHIRNAISESPNFAHWISNFSNEIPMQFFLRFGMHCRQSINKFSGKMSVRWINWTEFREFFAKNFSDHMNECERLDWWVGM